MIRRRENPDGLPYRVYERKGVRSYSIGYKLPDGRWAFRYSCPSADQVKIAELRRQAISESALLGHGTQSSGGTGELITAWLTWQEELPMNSPYRRAESTLAENRREAKNIRQAFGHMAPDAISKTDGYAYLDACEQASRPAKGNKEIALLQLILEYGVRIGRINTNPLAGLRKLKTKTERRYVTDGDLDLAVEVGRAAGGTRHVVAMALRTAYLCVRRSVEVRGITREAITDAGMVWKDGKSKAKADVLIEWTPELRATIEEAKQIKRNHVAGTMYLFGNMRGQRYTKGGWKAVLDDLMADCETLAKKRGVPFQRFSLQDCRPKGVSDKLASGQIDTQDATGHTSDRMIRQVYDRRLVKKAAPVR
jgi:integrase